MPDYTKEELLNRACLRVAMVMRGMYEEKKGSDTRLLNPPLIPDELVLVGRSKAITDKSYREHIIPRREIVLACHNMLEQNKSDEIIAAFIAEHVKIVLITPEEAKLLDGKLGLRQKMPEFWSFEDEKRDHYARLRTANIEWTSDDQLADILTPVS